ncbi:MAG: hypothetical protein AABO58_12705 [Acidobacteriota bacterium]
MKVVVMRSDRSTEGGDAGAGQKHRDERPSRLLKKALFAQVCRGYGMAARKELSV